MKKNKILIPTIVALSTITTIVSLTAASVSYSKNNSNDAKTNSSITANATYSTITYNTDDDVTLQGPIKARIRTNHVFGSAPKPTATHSSGIAFLGWSTTKGDIATIISNDTAVTSNLSVYPVFRYNLTLNPNGGTFKDGSTTNKDLPVDDNNKVSQPSDPSRIGYLFSGWYTTQECTAGTEFSFSQKITKVTTIYACWNSTTYSATLISNAGKFKTSEGTFTRLEYSNISVGTTIQELLTSKGITIVSDAVEVSYIGSWTTTGSDVLPASTTKITPNMVAYPLYITNGYAPELTEYPTAVGVKLLQTSNFYLSNDGTNAPELKYSTDLGATWEDVPTSSQTAISLEKGSNLYLKGNNTNGFSTSDSDYSTINISGKYNLSGSIMGLLDDGGKSSTITSIPNEYCFYGLFKDSTSLMKVKSDFLPSTSLKTYCYQKMFYGCTGLRIAPNLPATSTSSYCYKEMFYGCTGLLSCPTMSFTECTSYCCDSMFQNCINLVSTPSFENVTTLDKNCFYGMFSGCSGLKTIQNLPTLSADYAYAYMFKDCINLTTAPSTLGSDALTLSTHCYDSMFYGCKLLTSAPTELPATTADEYCCANMFYGCTSLTTAPALPATTLANYCYQKMFQGCTSLTSAPTELPATTADEYCCANMFYGCTSLTTAPALPATTLTQYCYQSMFQGCTSLTTAPALPATTLANYCYQKMFYGCTSLTSVPTKLPATTLTDHCYEYMFYGCTSLTTAPTLSATTLAKYCYSSMFYGCTLLTTAPALSVTTLTDCCYQSMFYGCKSLTTAPTKLPATTLTYECYEDMFHGCASLTTAPALPATTLAERCYSSMFNDCTSLTSAPELPATTLTQYCYQNMFTYCTKLTSAPTKLPATTAAEYCYRFMFSSCSSLTKPPIISLTTFKSACCVSMFYNCSNLNVTASSGTTAFFTTPDSTTTTYYTEMFWNTKSSPSMAASTTYYYN